ncbi:MAG: Gldg family protein [Clostridia bacterium]|nr:Gldg family protein [Clostridia bacterium]
MNFKTDKKWLKYGGFSVLITALVIVAVLGVNILATFVENNNGLKVDFTPTETYTLDKNAETALNDLEEEIVIYTFIPASAASNYSNMTQNIVELFDGASDKVTSRNVDPVVNPSKLKQFSTDIKDLSSYSVVVALKNDESNFHAFNESELVEYNSKTGKYYFVLQRWITSALVYLRTGVRQNVYVLTGHGEKINEETATMLNRIRRENYTVDEISLISGQQTLQQGDILVMLEPNSDLSKQEYDKIISFLDDTHGRLLFVATRLVDDAGNPLKNYNSLLTYFNLELADGVVAETDQSHRSAESAKFIELVADQTHDISAAVRAAKEPVWVSESTAFKFKYDSDITTGSYSETFTPILTSYSSSVLVPWSDASNFDVNSYKKGVNNLACAYERVNEGVTGTVATTATRILLFGSQSIGTADQLGNSNILRNGINWLAGRASSDTLVNVGVDLTSSYVQMSQLDMKIWFSVLVIAVPSIIFVSGVIVWIRRKNL